MGKLTITEYQELAKRTCPSLENIEDDKLHMRLGIFTECGELLDIFKKNLAYKKPIDLVNLGEEIADIAWYLVNEATLHNITLRDINSKKLLDEIGSIEVLTLTKLTSIIHFFEFYDIKFKLEFLVTICLKYGLDFEECLYKNIEKLKVRYPDKFDTEKALNRDLDAELKKLQ